jgi:SecD/SecF fusion protein
MKPFTWKIVICALPILISGIVVANAFVNYLNGAGGFKLGVDLVGGTILIYEVDVSKLQKNASGEPDWSYQQAQELARRLKSRIDPSDLYNMSIRVADSKGYRFEIIMPTGGTHQIEAEDKAWRGLLAEVERADGGNYKIQKYIVPPGQKTRLLADIYAQYPGKGNSDDPDKGVTDEMASAEAITKFIEDGYPYAQGAEPDDKAKKAWEKLLAQASKTYPPRTYEVGRGRILELANQIQQQHPDADLNEVRRVVKADETKQKSRRGQALTTEQVQERKELIAQQGSLEFRIVTNKENDSDAIDAAIANIRKLIKEQDDLKARIDKGEKNVPPSTLETLAFKGQPPPIPVRSDGGKFFDTKRGKYSYYWVELGPYYRFDHGLANPRDDKGNLVTIDLKHLDDEAKKIPQREEYQYWLLAAKAREKDGVIDNLPGTNGALIFTREVKTPRLTEDEREKKYEYWMLMRDREEGQTGPWPITGDLLSSASPGYEGNVNFRIKSEKAELFREFTQKNIQQLMAIVLDGKVESAATIQSAISSSGQITGKFTPQKIEELVKILRSGSLPATLKQQPVSENTMGPTLGADTIRKGALSILIAFAIVLVFMLVYYEFAGLVACIALMANLLLTLAFMVLIDATFTLPGLAGLVLMLGMAVDANILIYERLREERDRGAGLAMALRNGYDRALPTIIDTHLSSIFTAVVLYVVGNDQLKGFGISLTVGLIISLFTSLYMTRVIFDGALMKGWLTKLNMRRLFSKPNIDFMAIRYYWFTATVLLTILGAGLFLYRDKQGLNIDFIGGTAYGGVLTKPMDVGDIEKELRATNLPDMSVEQYFISDPEFTQGTKSRLFTVRTSERNAQKVLKAVNDALGQGTAEHPGPGLLETIDMSKALFLPDAPKGATGFTLAFTNPKTGNTEFASRAAVSMFLTQKLNESGVTDLENAAKQMRVDGLGKDKDGRFQWMEVRFDEPVAAKPALEKVLSEETQKEFANNPQPERLENFDSQLAQETQLRALWAILLSWGAILLYLWFRFGNWTFGAAAVLCLIHDLFFTLGIIAACHYVHDTAFGRALGLIDFKIDLPAVAALLTLVGYSVNDTIVVFDRIREVRGKNPDLTPQMINDSVNQTLSRTILTSLSVWLVVIVLYVIGGEGVHLFAFVMVVGVIVGTYSSIYIASPLLLIFGEGRSPTAARRPERAPVPQETGIRT